MKPTNFLFIISDQHRRDAAGCYGSPIVQTPNIDKLAARGTRFTTAYTNCAICVPVRAALMTGRYVHETGHWDNAFPYDGTDVGWAHRLKAQGYTIDSIGKLHFRSEEDDVGFTHSIEPLNVVNGEGDILSCVRDDPPPRNGKLGPSESGAGDSTYLQYDKRNGDNGCNWLRDHADDEKPWALFLSFVCPHPPFIAPQEFFDLYPQDQLPDPIQGSPADRPQHAGIDHLRRAFSLDEPLSPEVVRRTAAAYYGATSYLDSQIGRVLTTLDELGLTESTRIVYTSDHGESLGSRGLFGKFTMYEESAGIPMLLAGPGVPAGTVVDTPVSLMDIHPTAIEAVGAEEHPDDADLPGRSLIALANEPSQDRTVFGEYHAVGTSHGFFMLRDARYKYIYYVDAAPQLFDLQNDPTEERDLALDPAASDLLKSFEQRLRAICDPEAVDTQARADQQVKVDAHGGREAVIARGAFTNSPAPGEEAAWTAA